MLPRIVSRQLLKIPKEGESTTSRVQLELPVFQSVPAAFLATAEHHGEESDPILLTLSLQLFMHTEIASKPCLLWAEQVQLYQAFLVGVVIQLPNHFCWPSLDFLQELGVPSSTGGLRAGHSTPEMASSAQSRGGGPSTFDLLATVFLMHFRIPLAFLVIRAHCWLTTKLLSSRKPRSSSAELLSSRKALSLYWCMALCQVQDSALAVVEFQEIPLYPSFQPRQTLLNGSTALFNV